MAFALNRREMTAGLLAAAAFAPAFARGGAGEAAPGWLGLLSANASAGKNYAPRIEGKVPAALSGALYRNGPGLFSRGDMKKRHLLDGDGVVQRLSFRDGAVTYRNAFVATDKFVEEEKAGKFIYSTWSTPRPGGPLSNLGGGPFRSQAGVTVYPIGDAVVALDETNPAYDLDPESLATLGTRHIGDPETVGGIKAHAKFDPVRKEWLFIGQSFGRKFDLHAITHDERGAHVSTRTIADTRQVYIHDFLATQRYFVFVMHPCEMHVAGFLAGMKSIIESMKWNGAAGNEVILVPRDGGEPKRFEAPGAFMWHALNAYDDGGDVVADFVAYDDPDHFIGDSPQLATIMEGRLGRAIYPGKIRRYRMNVAAGRLAEEIVDAGDHEFPMTDPRVALSRHRVGYFAHAGTGVLNSGLKRLDYETGAVETYDFGAGHHVGEPVFAARPGGALDEGWLIQQGLDGASGKTFFAVFDAAAVSDGPLAKIWLDHPMPISFHGAWRPV